MVLDPSSVTDVLWPGKNYTNSLLYKLWFFYKRNNNNFIECWEDEYM